MLRYVDKLSRLLCRKYSMLFFDFEDLTLFCLLLAAFILRNSKQQLNLARLVKGVDLCPNYLIEVLIEANLVPGLFPSHLLSSDLHMPMCA